MVVDNKLKFKTKKEHHIGQIISKAFIYLILILLCIIFLYPMWQALVCSFSSPNAVASQNGALLFVEEPQVEAYKMLFQSKYFWNGVKNSIVYVALGTLLQYVVTVLAAYALSVPHLRFKKTITIYFIITMFFSGGLIPQYLLVNNLKLTNTIWAFILPSAVNVWSILVMRTQFSGIPQELRQAAQIDGAGDFRILFRIYLPVSRAVSFVILIFTAVSFWNMWFEPLLYMTERSGYPLQSILREILIENSTSIQAGSSAQKALLNNADMSSVGRLVKYASIIISSTPVLITFPFLHKFFSNGVMTDFFDD